MRALARRAALAMPLVALIRPARATPESMAAAMREFARGAPLRRARVAIDIPLLVENGNAVPLTVSVESPMIASDHVVEIALFNERNPLPDIARFQLGPRAGRAWVATRIRLGDSQAIAAVARMNDGSAWTASADLIVTLPACIDPQDN
jgi:sulfur-oxidizing protein SoxY